MKARDQHLYDRVIKWRARRRVGCYGAARGIAGCALAFSLLFSPVAMASLADLLAQPSRPTMLQLSHDTDGYFSPEALNLIPTKHPDPRVQEIDRTAGSVIASLEYTYPGATYAFLGRDSSFLADVVEGFYLSIGQTDRVVRLDASSGSFENSNPALYVQLLKQNGLHLDTDGVPTQPYVIIDATSWRESSQSRQLVRAIYNQYRHADKSILFDKINAVGQGAQSQGTKYNGEQITPSLDVQRYFSKLNAAGLGPSSILYTTNVFAYGDNSWHGPFGEFSPKTPVLWKFRRIQAQRGEPSSPFVKEEILGSMIRTGLTVSLPSFRELVASAFSEFGMDYSRINEFRELMDQSRTQHLAERTDWTPISLRSWRGDLSKLPVSLRRRINDLSFAIIKNALVRSDANPLEWSELIAELAVSPQGFLKSKIFSKEEKLNLLRHLTAAQELAVLKETKDSLVVGLSFESARNPDQLSSVLQALASRPVQALDPDQAETFYKMVVSKSFVTSKLMLQFAALPLSNPKEFKNFKDIYVKAANLAVNKDEYLDIILQLKALSQSKRSLYTSGGDWNQAGWIVVYADRPEVIEATFAHYIALGATAAELKFLRGQLDGSAQKSKFDAEIQEYARANRTLSVPHPSAAHFWQGLLRPKRETANSCGLALTK